MDERLEALERLASLRERNVLTEAEYEIEKSRLLGGQSIYDRKDDPAELDAGCTNRKRWALGGILTLIAIGGGVMFAASPSGETLKGMGTGTRDAQAIKGAKQAQAPIRLSAILKFEDAHECRPADELQTLLSDMRSLNPNDDPGTITVGVDGPAVQPTVQDASGEGASAVIAQLIAPSTWQGLRVSEIRTTRFADSEIETFQIRFKEAPERVRRKLNDAGFELPELGKLATREREDGHTLALGLERTEGATTLLCSTI